MESRCRPDTASDVDMNRPVTDVPEWRLDVVILSAVLGYAALLAMAATLTWF